MSYIPKNVNVYAAAQAGAMSGMGLPGSAAITDQNAADYQILSNIAGAFAQEFDTPHTRQPEFGQDGNNLVAGEIESRRRNEEVLRNNLHPKHPNDAEDRPRTVAKFPRRLLHLPGDRSIPLPRYTTRLV